MLACVLVRWDEMVLVGLGIGPGEHGESLPRALGGGFVEWWLGGLMRCRLVVRMWRRSVRRLSGRGGLRMGYWGMFEGRLKGAEREIQFDIEVTGSLLQ